MKCFIDMEIFLDKPSHLSGLCSGSHLLANIKLYGNLGTLTNVAGLSGSCLPLLAIYSDMHGVSCDEVY